MRPRALGGEIGEADGDRLVGDGVRRIVGEKVHAGDDGVAGDDELLPFGIDSTAASSSSPSAAGLVASGAK